MREKEEPGRWSELRGRRRGRRGRRGRGGCQNLDEDQRAKGRQERKRVFCRRLCSGIKGKKREDARH